MAERASQSGVEFLLEYIDLPARHSLSVTLDSLGQQEIVLEPGADHLDRLQADPQVGVLLYLDNAYISHVPLEDCAILRFSQLPGPGGAIGRYQEHYLGTGSRGLNEAADQP